MHHMDSDEWRAFVSHGTRTGKLAVTRKDGTPHVVPIWFLIDGDDIVFTTGEDTVKARALRHDPRCALCVDSEEPPFSYVQLTATATLTREAPDLLDWATRLATRYMGADLAESYGKRNAVPTELLVRARITKVIAQAEIAN